MRISRLYVTDTLIVGQPIMLADDSAHYLRTVLRLKKGQNIRLFNGQGGEYLCCLQEVSKQTVSARVMEYIERNIESTLKIVLGLGISRGNRMDWAIQKSVELGVHQITPLLTERCVTKFNHSRKQQRVNHWRKIVQHASEQSGRTILPVLSDIDRPANWITDQQGLKIFLDPYAECVLNDLQPNKGAVCVLSGPEGGFTEQERESACQSGFVPVRLGNRILRTETAAIAALSAMQLLWGDFN